MDKNEQQLPRLGEPVPAFEAMTTQGKVSFPADYKGKWVILFSPPADFTPICTSEVLTFGARTAEFKALNCELIGLSVDSRNSHIAWLGPQGGLGGPPPPPAISRGCARSAKRSNTRA